MGKSDIIEMSSLKRQNNLKLSMFISCNDQKQALNNNYNDSNDDDEDDDLLPEDMQIYPNQVSGHMNDGKSIGLIKHKKTILKPITNYECGEREINFYNEIQITTDATLNELKEFLPKFYGTKQLTINSKLINNIILEDLTKNFIQPCIMDIKIGRRTWDPLASYNKIIKEDDKYKECKRDLGFCITGFQVYKLINNQFIKHGKEFGKKLTKETVPEVLKLFLNANATTNCNRSLIVQLLADLWRIQHWARRQCKIRLYSSSLLLVYDAKRLKDSMRLYNNNNNDNNVNKPVMKLTRSTSLYRPLSLAILNNNNINEKIQTGFSGQLTKDGPILKSRIKITKELQSSYNNNNINNNVWQKSIRTLKRTHSFQNNYDKDLQNKKQDYNLILDDLCCDNQLTRDIWASVKMIDFAHVFPSDKHKIDDNYLEGIVQLIKLFEDFLVESQ